MFSAKPIRILFSLLVLLTATRSVDAAVSIAAIGKESYFHQTGPNPGDISPDPFDPINDSQPYSVFASVQVDNRADVDGAWVRLVSGDGGIPIPLEWEADESSYVVYQGFASKAALDSGFEDGDYGVTFQISGGSTVYKLLSVREEFPNTPFIENWSELQNIQVGEDVTIRWNAMSGGAADDIITVTIVEPNGWNAVFETPFHYLEPNGLDGTARSVTVPAGTLAAGQDYELLVSFDNIETVDNGVTWPGVLFGSTHFAETHATIKTGVVFVDPVSVGAVGREVYYFQSGQGAPALDLEDNEQFGSLAVLIGDSVDQLASASVTLPGGESRSMTYDTEDGDFGAFKSNVSMDAMLADFVSGDYTLRYEVTGGGQVAKTVSLGDAFPAAPQISNWTAAQSVQASEAFMIRWLPVEGLTEADAISVFVEDPEGVEVFVSDVSFLDPSGEGLSGSAVSVTLPAGTLQVDKTYFVSVDALQFTDLDQGSVGQTFLAFNLRSTGFNLTTTSGNLPPSITTETLPNADESQGYSADVMGSDAEDGSTVTIAADVLPGWLTLADQGNGTAELTGTPSAANVGTFTVRVSVTDSQGLVARKDYSVTVNPDLTDPEGRALDIMSIGWQRDGQAPFLAQITDVQAGESALVSGAIGDGVSSSLQASFTGPLKLSFHWKVSSQAGKDFFRVRVDGVSEAEISGELNWREQIIDVPAGVHTVRWAYEKDGSGNAGSDRGWLDHVSILPLEAGVFAGTYLGGIKSSTGTVSLYIRPNNTAVFLGYHPESGKGLSNFALTIADTGGFSFEVVNPDDMENNYTVTGSVSDGVATGSVSGLGLTFTANLISGGGQLVSYDGYYQNALTATASGLVYLIVATDGQAYFYAQDRGYVEGYITTIDATGNIGLTTDQGFDYDLTVDKTTDIVAGTYTPPGGETAGILGIREGSPGDELLANISTRGKVLTGDKVMIASFVITGTGSKNLLIRAIGPRLVDFGVGGVLPDPVIDLIRLGETVPMVTNDDWGDGGQTTQIISDSIRLGAFGLVAGSRDSVLTVSLEPGAYTAAIRGNGGLTGVSLVEVYDGDNPTERLPTADVSNISTRGEVGTGADALIAGFVVSGDVSKRILIRGVGPQLEAFGVSGTLGDPRIDLTNSDDVLVGSNDNWGDNPDVASVVSAMAEVGAFALGDGSKDAAMLIWLPPGAYTAKVSGADGGSGVALIEVYDN